MFKKLKDKIAEEVRQSPQKFQQIAQAAGYNVQDTNNTSTDKFFSISDETPQNSPAKQPTATPRPRRLSNSSMNSDVSFKLPAYDCHEPNPYHFSDMESASEIDESASAQMGQLDLVSKEQLHLAYKKSLERYQKYRGLYTDLARKYKDLERDNQKARSVLVETQDKALRRISELREQCSLEQQAKAHLESSLRLEMDEMECKIKTLTTKLELINDNGEKQDLLIDLEHAESGLESSSDQNSQSENEVETHYKTQLIEKDAKIIILNEKIANLQTKLDELSAKDETNAVSIAENKMVIHSELEAKETEVKACKEKVEKAEQENRDLRGKIETLQKQLLESKAMNTANNELLKEKLKELESALKTSSDDKHKLEMKFVDLEKEIFDSKNTNIGLTETVEKLKSEKQSNDEKLDTFKVQITQLQGELKKAHDDITNFETFRAKTSEILFQDRVETETEKILNSLTDIAKDKTLIEQRFKDLHEEKQKLAAQLKSVEEELKKKSPEGDLVIQNLKKEIQKLENAAKDTERKTQTLKTEITHLQAKAEELEALKLKHDEIQASLLLQQNEIQEKQDETETLRSKLAQAKQEKRDLEKTLEREIREKSELKTQVTNILQEITRLEENLLEVKTSHSTIQSEKEALVLQIEQLHQQHHETKREIEETCKREWEEQVGELEKIKVNLGLKCSGLEKSRMQLETDREKDQIELTELKKKLEEKQTNVDDLKVELDGLNSSATDSQKQLEEIQKLWAATKDDFEALKLSETSKIAEIEKLKQDLQATSSELEVMSATRISTLEQALSDSETKLREMSNEKEKLEELTKSLTESEVKVTELSSEVTKMQGALNKATELHESSEAKISELVESLTKHEVKLTELTSENAKLLEEKELAAENVRSLEAKLQNDEKRILSISSLEEQKLALSETCDSLMERVDALKQENLSLRSEREQLLEREQSLKDQLDGANNKFSIRESKFKSLTDEHREIVAELETARHTLSQFGELTEKVRAIEAENSKLQTTIRKSTDVEAKLHELEERNSNLLEQVRNLKDLETKINELEVKNTKLTEHLNHNEDHEDVENVRREKEQLDNKLQTIMHEVQDVSNRNLFLEQKCENYLILEQTNERLKNQNEKLKNQLDETLISLHHNEGLAANTEFEYLRNILFQYLSGSSANGKTLVKVIAAVLKFTPQQTQVVLEKESQRHTLVGQLNNLL